MIWLKRCPSRLTKLSTSSWIFSLIFFHRPLFFMRHQWMRITNSRHDISLEVHSNDWRDLENSHMTSTKLKDVSCAWHNEETKILTKSQAGKNFNRPIQFQNLHLTRFKVFPLQRYISWSSLTCLLDELLRIFCWFSNCGSWSENFCRLKGGVKILTIYTLISVCIFSILFSIHFLRCWQGEFVYRSKASFVDNHFLYSCDLNILFRGDIVRRIKMLVTVWGKGVSIFFINQRGVH